MTPEEIIEHEREKYRRAYRVKKAKIDAAKAAVGVSTTRAVTHLPLDLEELDDYATFIEKYIPVRNKIGRVVPTVLWAKQREYCERRRKARDEEGRWQLARLKVRQEGNSTIVGFCDAIDMLRAVVQGIGVRLGVIADRVPVGKHIAREYVYNPLLHLSKTFDFELSKFKNTTEEVCFTLEASNEERRCEAWVLTANSQDKLGRSFTFHLLFCSEVARWQRGTVNTDGVQAEEAFLAALNSVPDASTGAECFIDVESTAAGAYGAFYDICLKAQDQDEGWDFMFSAWFEHEEYIEPGDWSGEDAGLDRIRAHGSSAAKWIEKEEVALALKYPQIKWAQFLWRRRCIKVKCKGSLAKFRQEYPSNPTEAFIVSGESVFDSELVEKAIAAAKANPGQPCSLSYEDKAFTLGAYIGFDPELFVWEPPDTSLNYVLAADVSLGVGGMYEEENKKHIDRSVASVWCVETGQQVAEYRGIPAPEDFAVIVYNLGMFYGEAIANIERNTHGTTVINILLEKKYPHLFCFVAQLAGGGWAPPVIGTPIFKHTREPALSLYRKLFKAGVMKPRSLTLLREMAEFHTVNGRLDHRQGGYDDCVFAAVHAGLILANPNPLLASDIKDDLEPRDYSAFGASEAWVVGQALRVEPRQERYGDSILDPWRKA